jgi:hypothetical protein
VEDCFEKEISGFLKRMVYKCVAVYMHGGGKDERYGISKGVRAQEQK